MKNSMLLLMAAVILVMASCKKENETTPEPLSLPHFTNLSVGNYWIFRGFDLDPSGVATPTNDWDSAYISKDTLINGIKYFKMHEKSVIIAPRQEIIFLRDSSDYLVNQFGQILFAETNFTDTLSQDTSIPTQYRSFTMMVGKDSSLTVPAGEFLTRTILSTIISTDSLSPYPVRYCYTVYGEGVGKIKTHDFFFFADKHFEKRLIRYKVRE